MEWDLKAFNELTNEELYRILQARVDVFVVEQTCPYPEIDGHDFDALHLAYKDGEELAAYLRILPKGATYEQAALGRILVKESYRGEGLAQRLIRKALDFIRDEWNEKEVRIQAQNHLRSFYESFGFAAISDVYDEDGIPHIDMILQFAD